MRELSTVDSPSGCVGPDTVLRPVARCIVREQVDQFLIYNANSDEMHLVPPAGMHAYWLCDGVRCAREVAVLLADAFEPSQDPEVGSLVYSFLDGLVVRRILEPVSGASR